MKLLVILSILLTSQIAFAQIAINTDGNTPDSSAMLDISSSDKGILIPRMTTNARELINNPATGLLVYDTDAGGFWYYNNSQWNEIGAGVFSSQNGITSSSNNDDDFVFGADSVNHGMGTETKLFFEKEKGAFRVGRIENSNWDTDSLGFFSLSSGLNTKAIGNFSTAFGAGTEALNNYTSAWGQNTIASGNYATASGSSNTASGDFAWALGLGNTVSGGFSFAIGSNLQVTQSHSAAFGLNNRMLGSQSFVVGNENTVNSAFSFTAGLLNTTNSFAANALGSSNIVNGSHGNAFGLYLIAASFGETVIGSYNTKYTPNETTTIDSNDRLFVIGNGIDTTNRSDALRIYKNGNVEMNGALTIDSAYTLPVVDGTQGQVLTTDGQGNITWSEDTAGAFSSQNGVTTSSNNDDDFIFGADSLNHGMGSESKLFFNQEKGAFRVGIIDNTNWDKDSLGVSSFAMGSDTKAKGFYSAAWGERTTASGSKSTAWGDGTIANGIRSTAWGDGAEASGNRATAWGEESIASGSQSTAWGGETIASGELATAWGDEAVASGSNATAWGDDAVAGGRNATAWGDETMARGRNATAWGDESLASGNASTAAGDEVIAPSYAEVAIGTNNTIYTPNDSISFDVNDRLFVIGNGQFSARRSDALRVYKNGNMELNGALTIDSAYTFPVVDGIQGQVLTTDGHGNITWSEDTAGAFSSQNGITTSFNNNDDLVFGADSLNHLSGQEYKLFFDKSSAAIRAGSINTDDWDQDSLGFASIALGENPKATGLNAVALGFETNASGTTSTALGSQALASGRSAVAMGDNAEATGDHAFAVGSFGKASGNHAISLGRSNTASGDYSISLGRTNQASGHHATAIGNQVSAKSYGETTLGIHNTTYTAMDSLAFNANDRLFVIGNGIDPSNRSDALRIYKNGNTELNGALTIDSAYTLPVVDGSQGQVLTTDGSGNISWSEDLAGAFSSQNGITTSANNDDFVFGADSLNHVSGQESKLFYDKDKRAFRVGYIDNRNWDTDSLGLSSFAGGYNTRASGEGAFAYGDTNGAEGNYSVALGAFAVASNDFAMALGLESTASGFNSTVFGHRNVASGSFSTAFGELNTASGNGAVAWGEETTASAGNATAWGNESTALLFGATAWGTRTTASGGRSTVWGYETIASELNATAWGHQSQASGRESTAYGFQSLASGDVATAIGTAVNAPSYSEMAVGSYNSIYTPVSTNNIVANDRLFVVGNGTNSSNRSDALRIYKSGNVELNGALTIDSSYTFPVVDGAVGQMLTTNGNGDVSWTTLTDQDNQTIDNFQLAGTTLNLSLENDGQNDYSVNLSSLQDDLGDHTASQNIRLSDNWISNDGGNEGLKIENDGDVQLGGDLLVGTNSIRFNNDSWGTAFSFSDIGPNDFEILIPQSIITDEGIQLNGSWMSNDGGNEGLTIDMDGNVSTSSNLGVGGALSAQNSLSLFNGNQNVVLVADNANRRVILDVGGSGASSDAFIIGDLTSGVNEVLMLGNVGIGTFSTPQKLTVGARGDGTKAVANEWDTWSDKRLKRDIQEIQNPLEKLAAINGYYYYWTKDMPDQSKQVGVIAQEMETVLPEIVTTNSDGYKSVDYTKLTALLIEVNQAQQQEIDELKIQLKQLGILEQEHQELKAQVDKIDQLEKRLNQLQSLSTSK